MTVSFCPTPSSQAGSSQRPTQTSTSIPSSTLSQPSSRALVLGSKPPAPLCTAPSTTTLLPLPPPSPRPQSTAFPSTTQQATARAYASSATLAATGRPHQTAGATDSSRLKNSHGCQAGGRPRTTAKRGCSRPGRGHGAEPSASGGPGDDDRRIVAGASMIELGADAARPCCPRPPGPPPAALLTEFAAVAVVVTLVLVVLLLLPSPPAVKDADRDAARDCDADAGGEGGEEEAAVARRPATTCALVGPS